VAEVVRTKLTPKVPRAFFFALRFHNRESSVHVESLSRFAPFNAAN